MGSPFWLCALTLLLLFVASSSQDTKSDSAPSSSSLFCGASTYQISADPSRPSVVVGGGTGGSGPPTSAKYQFVGIDTLMRNVCALIPATPQTNTFPGRLVITRCEDCSKCPQELANIHRTLTKIGLEAGIQSLLVILNREFDHVKSSARLVDSSMTKYVFLDEDDLGSPTICELSDSGDGDSLKSFSKTSVLFVSISFIILMVISLAWLVFYYVQRFRYAHAKDRLQRRLFNAAKKALARIPTRPVKAGDKELSSDCPVCIDPYRQGDICRQLPCRHIFHKSCVDPWLLEHRTCPMCKSDILKAFGYHVNGHRRRAQFSANVEEDGATGEHELHRGDTRLSLDANSTGSESANPFPIVTEVHDPFGFTPSASPQLIQMVQGSPGGLQIVPLTVNVAQSPYCSIIQTSIERHADLEAEQHSPPPVEQAQTSSMGETTTAAAAEADPSKVVIQQPPQQPSAPIRLFRAVTGRRHIVNLVHVRSRSFSQSQLATVGEGEGECGVKGLPSSNSTVFGGEGPVADAIIYSVGESNDSRPQEGEEAAKKRLEEQQLCLIDPPNFVSDFAPTKGAPRAVTAPSGFRRKAPPQGTGSRHSQREKSLAENHEGETTAAGSGVEGKTAVEGEPTGAQGGAGQ